MTVDPELLAERSASVLAHLDRVAGALPDDPDDLARVHAIAASGPTDLRAFLAVLRDQDRRSDRR